MKYFLHSTCAGLAVATLMMCGLANQAQAVSLWTGGTGDFYDGTNWSTNPLPPGAADAAIVSNGGTAIIDVAGTTVAGSDVLSLNGGVLAAGNSGNIRMESGFIRTSDNSTFATQANTSGSFVMNGGTIHIGDVSGLPAGEQTLPNVDLVFATTADTTGNFEMHGTSVYRGVDDITLGDHNFNGPVGSAATSVTSFVMDGNSEFSQGDGFNTRGTLTMTLSDNAVMTLGNTLGAANAAGAYARNSGYINIGSRRGSQANIVVENNAVFNASRIQNNVGTSTITVRDNGEFNIFNTSTGGTEVDFQGQSYLSRESHSSDGPSSTIITLEGFGKFTVDSNPVTVNDDGSDGHGDLLPQAGLTLAGGDDEPVQLPASGNSNGPGGNNYNGGYVLIDVKDSAELFIVQDLWMTYGTGSAASSTVKVTGPDATVSIGGDLNMAIAINQRIEGSQNAMGTVVNDGFVNRSGTAALHSVITGSSHSTILVGDEARIGNGQLIVELSGYSPVFGDSYTLLQTSNSSGVDGEFNNVDLSLASLSGSLMWKLDYNPSSVVLSVVPEPTTSLLLALAAATCLVGRKRSAKM